MSQRGKEKSKRSFNLTQEINELMIEIAEYHGLPDKTSVISFLVQKEARLIRTCDGSERCSNFIQEGPGVLSDSLYRQKK